jgi:hypothetical protein
LAAGIANESDVLEVLGRLPITAISNYHRRLAVNVLGPLLEQNSELAKEFGGILQALLKGPINEEALQAFIQIPGVHRFDQEIVAFQGEMPPDFRIIEIDYID